MTSPRTPSQRGFSPNGQGPKAIIAFPASSPPLAGKVAQHDINEVWPAGFHAPLPRDGVHLFNWPHPVVKDLSATVTQISTRCCCCQWDRRCLLGAMASRGLRRGNGVFFNLIFKSFDLITGVWLLAQFLLRTLMLAQLMNGANKIRPLVLRWSGRRHR